MMPLGEETDVHDAARLRLRDLTQEVYDIGDEIAEAVDNVAAAMTDWDAELVDDCMHELAESVEQGRPEVRQYLAEINGLRQAFVSGVQSGTLSGTIPVSGDTFYHPGRTLAFLHPRQSLPELEDRPRELFGPVVSTATLRTTLRRRNTELTGQLAELAEWVVAQTAEAVEHQTVLLPQAFAKTWTTTRHTVATWKREVISDHPALVAEMRGEAPPEFLADRARVEQVLARVRARNRDRRRRSVAG
ncbi:hypothetical protein [Corynebacterium terpenotabidum]|uniref:Uncharacterized protein n=1 Tax=Corynebacterium terpenotabidum Y-11 TaxID=1200352 RepID=S4XD88_9CORY|nr:hypothetical protein A606_04125 [Corynebacterium terpenotabidum Y-11]